MSDTQEKEATVTRDVQDPIVSSEATSTDIRFFWNWGAFMLGPIFGVGNRAWAGLLSMVPVLNIVWIFVFGANGEKWAWNSGAFKNEAEFRATMRSWNRAGVFFLILLAVSLLISVVFFGVLAAMIQQAIYNGEFDTNAFSTLPW